MRVWNEVRRDGATAVGCRRWVSTTSVVLEGPTRAMSAAELMAESITASIGDLHSKQQTLLNAAAEYSKRYQANLQIPAQRKEVYSEAELMATGCIKSIAEGSITVSAQLSEFLSETLGSLDKFESSVTSAGNHLSSMRSLAGTAGKKKLRIRTGDVEVNDIGANLEFKYSEEPLPLPSYARLDAVGDPLAVLRGTQDEKPFLSQFRRPVRDSPTHRRLIYAYRR